MTARAVTRHASMQEAARSLAREFLQTVVVVDDRASFGEAPPEPDDGVIAAAADSAAPDEVSTRTRARRSRVQLIVPPTPAEPSTPPEQALDAKTLVDAFAEHGIVCGVIRPTPTDNPIERTVNAARRADIVVLDWELNNDHGETTLQIIRDLVQEDTSFATNAEPRLRLIAVYSGAVALRQIATKIRDSISTVAKGANVRKNGDFALRVGMVRIVVFSKPTTRLAAGGRALAGLKKRIVTPANLPETLIREFAELTTGLVPSVALASLAALRKNTHRVLAQLRSDLDPAYLWHRATQVRPADAEDHLVRLVAEELHSVLEDERVGEWANIEAIEKWIASDGRGDFSAAFGEQNARSPADVKALLTKGAAAGLGDVNKDVREQFKKMCADKDAHSKDIAGFAKNPQAARRANEHFARLMSLRTRYENPVPRLELGTILSKGRGKTRTYWLCVQPRCDSVRLREKMPFPMLPLTPATEGKKFDIVLPSRLGGHLRLRISKKPSDLRVPVFAVNPAGGDAVLARKFERGGFAFVAKNGDRYYWTAELKPEHAQRIAQQIANEFSRVGLNESEWLRLWAK